MQKAKILQNPTSQAFWPEVVNYMDSPNVGTVQKEMR